MFIRQDKITVLQAPISKTSFKATVIRERKRTERSGLAIALLMVGLENDKDIDPSEFWDDISKALLTIKSEIDIFGWFEHEAVMGLIALDIEPSTLANCCEHLELRVRKELTERLDDDTMSRLSIRLRVYPEPATAGE